MIRAAIYSRYSHEDSTSKSIVDQVATVRQYASRLGAQVVREYSDEAISGSSRHIRPGLKSLMDDADRKAFDVVLVFKLDRLSREMEDMAFLFRQLTFLGIELHDTTLGKVDTLHVGVHGLMGTLFLEGHAEHVRRGQIGTIAQGRSAGGRPYGYRPTAVTGELEICPDEADTIRLVFSLRLAGHKPREIAARLNEKAIPAPRGARWNASTINGSGSRGNGILRNPLYKGLRVWDRLEMIRNPTTGKRVSRKKETPPEEAPVPHLAIVDEATFEAVQALFHQNKCKRPHQQRKAKYLLSGKLRCECGSGMSIKDRDHGRRRCQCSRHRESGACENNRTYYLDEIESGVLRGIKERLLSPAFLAELIGAYNDESIRLAEAQPDRLSALSGRFTKLSSDVERIWRDYEAGHLPIGIAGPHLKRLEAEKTSLAAEIEAASASSAQREALDEMSVRRARDALASFEKLFDGGVTDETREAAEAIQALIDTVTVRNEPNGIELHVEGTLAALLNGKSTGRAPFGVLSGGSVVAEERYRLSPQHPNIRYCLLSCA